WSSDVCSSDLDWVKRAEEVATILQVDAVERDRVQNVPHAEVQLLKDAGLVNILWPVALGGGGQTWATAYQVIRRVSEGDGSIGQLLGYHLEWSQLAEFYGIKEQAAELAKKAAEIGRAHV